MLPSRLNEKASRSPRLAITGWAFSNSYAALPAQFYARLDPVPVADPRLIKFNDGLASELKLERGPLDDATLASIFSGNTIPQGADPVALAYAGHQFGHFVPQLGDGRAILLAETVDRFGIRRDIQLKGSGRTPFSRGGDGRAALGPVLREYLVSEAMHALGVASTRSLAAVVTGEQVLRGGRQPGAIVTRIASSHVRVGTFQYFAARADHDSVRVLADYVIERHYPQLRSADQRYLALLRAVADRQASLVASWMQVGFIHGVMNTDNTALSGETIDFGPCAFMDSYDPAAVFSSIDAGGRYAYSNQPAAAQWNLARFAETLLSLIDPDVARAIEAASGVIEAFPQRFEEHWLVGMRRKLGLSTDETGDPGLIRAWLELMHRSGCDFTLTFRALAKEAAVHSDAVNTEAVDAAGVDAGSIRALFAHPPEYDAWALEWRSRLSREPRSGSEIACAMRAANPAFIARNHRVEQAIAAAVEHQNFEPFEQLLKVLARPYDDQPGFEAYGAAPTPSERVLQTFCGT